MRPAPGDLAYCVVPPGYQPTLHLRFCTIRAAGHDDLSPTVALGIQDLLFCEWCSPVVIDRVLVRGCWVAAAWMRKASGPGADAGEDEGARVPATSEAVPA